MREHQGSASVVRRSRKQGEEGQVLADIDSPSCNRVCCRRAHSSSRSERAAWEGTIWNGGVPFADSAGRLMSISCSRLEASLERRAGEATWRTDRNDQYTRSSAGSVAS